MKTRIKNSSVWHAAILLPLFLIARGTGSVIVDGFQSLGAVACSSVPGDLHWPMLGGFLGYDRTWGFHWMGWPWIRSLLLPIIPWNPTTELGLCFLIWWVMAWILTRMVRTQEGHAAAIGVSGTALVAPGFLVAAQSYRPEIPAALALVAALAVWNDPLPGRRILCSVLGVILPTLHPLGFVVPAAWCGFDFLLKSKHVGVVLSLRTVAVRAFPLLLGLVVLVSWLAAHPPAWSQFKLNIESQRTLVEGLGSGYGTFFRWGMGSLGSLPLILLLGVALPYGVYLIGRFLRSGKTVSPQPIVYAAVGVAAALGFNILAKNPNSLHVVAILPLAAWLFVSALRQGFYFASYSVAFLPLGLAWLIFLALPIKRGAALLMNHGTSYRDQLDAGLNSIPKARQVLIPVAMWEAAALKHSDATVYRFSTFPNILPATLRSEYESALLAKTLPGDLLVWDALQDQGGVFNFVTQTALRHQIIKPAEDHASWERLPDVRIRTVYSQNQPSVFQVYRKR